MDDENIDNNIGKIQATKEFDDVKWEDVDMSNEKISSIQGRDPKQLRAKEFRTICSRLKVRGVKNVTKEVMIQKLTETGINRKLYKSREESWEKKRNCETAQSKESEESVSTNEQRGNSSSSSGSKRKIDAISAIADAIRELNQSKVHNKYSMAKLRHMEVIQENMAREEERKEKEEQRKSKSDMFDLWEKVNDNIRKLRKDFKQETDEDVKKEIDADIKGLQKEKKQLSDILGF